MTTNSIGEVVDYLHEIAPEHFQESYDNSGLLVGNRATIITSVLISLDCTEAIVEEAIQLGANLIISHHPIVFRGLKKFTGSTYVERTITKAIKNDIAILAIHTNLDNMRFHGVNTKIAEKLNLTDLRLLSPIVTETIIQVGSGMIGHLPNPMDLKDFLEMLKHNMQLNTIKYTADTGKKIKTVAICGGSGSFLLPKAIEAGADAFVTSDYKYHEFFDADDRLVICDIGHYESERFTIELLFSLISNKFCNFASHCTRIDTNPIKYYN
jgi:dinuclear metal center YbgI/SA1388 family protein